MRFIHFFLIFTLFTLSACGGGGGNSSSGGTTPTPPPVETGTIDVSQSAVNFSASQFGALPAPQILTIEFDAPLVTAGTLPGEGLPSWLSANLTQTGDNEGRLELRVLDTDLEPASLTTTIRLASSNAAGSNVLDTVDIPVNYTIEPITLLETSAPLIEVELAPIQEPVTRTITLMGEGVTWNATNFDGRVITVSPSSGTIPAGGQEINIMITPAKDEFSRTTEFIVTFFEVSTRQNSTTLDIEVTLTDGVFIDPPNVSFTATVGSVDVQSQTVTIDSFDISPEAQINWTATSNQPWLRSTPMGGSIDPSASPENLSNIIVSANPTGLPTGVYPGEISFTNDVSTQVFTLPVDLIVGERNITASRKGVALSSLSTLEQVINITDGFGADVPWQATSNASWLTVTPSGAAGTPLTLTADPAGLDDNNLSEATITLTSPLSDITNEVLISVGLWNSAVPTEDVSIDIGPDGFGAPDVILEDPVRPYVYALVHDGFSTGINITSTLSAYNVYTGERVSGPITTQVPGPGKLIVSDDGSSLYAFPASFDGQDAEFEQFNPTDLTSSGLIDLPAEFLLGGAEFTRINGVPYIISGSGGVFDIETGSLLSNVDGLDGFDIFTSRNNSVACIPTVLGQASTRLDCYNLLGTGIAGMDIAANRRNVMPIDINPEILGISPDGFAVYIREQSIISAVATDNSPSQFFSLDDSDSLFVSQTGLLGTTGIGDPELAQSIVNTYESDGTFIGTTDGADGIIGANQFAVFSGDETRIILLEAFDSRILKFTNAP